MYKLVLPQHHAQSMSVIGVTTRDYCRSCLLRMNTIFGRQLGQGAAAGRVGSRAAAADGGARGATVSSRPCSSYSSGEPPERQQRDNDSSISATTKSTSTKSEPNRTYQGREGPSRTLLRMRERMRAHHGILEDSAFQSVSNVPAKRTPSKGTLTKKSIENEHLPSTVEMKMTSSLNESSVVADKINSADIYEKYDFLRNKDNEDMDEVLGMTFGLVRLDSANKPSSQRHKTRKFRTDPSEEKDNEVTGKNRDGGAFIDDQYFNYKALPSKVDMEMPKRMGGIRKHPVESDYRSSAVDVDTYSGSAYIDEQYFCQVEEHAKHIVGDELEKDDDCLDHHSLESNTKTEVDVETTGNSYIDDQYFDYTNETANSSTLIDSIMPRHVDLEGSTKKLTAKRSEREAYRTPDKKPISRAQINQVQAAKPIHESLTEETIHEGPKSVSRNSRTEETIHEGPKSVSKNSRTDGPSTKQTLREDGRKQKSQKVVPETDDGFDEGPVTNQMLRQRWNQPTPGKVFEVAMDIRSQQKQKTRPEENTPQAAVHFRGPAGSKWDGKVDTHGFRILTGQVLNCDYLPESTVVNILKDSIIYQDDEIIAIDKPYGIASHGGPGVHHSIGKLLPPLAKRCGLEELHLVHRLDKETTGVMVLAKSNVSEWKLLEMFRKRIVIKKYLVITKGVPNPREGTIDIPMAESIVQGKYRMTLRPHYSEKTKVLMGRARRVRKSDAVTNYRVLASENSAALVECRPESGLKHQIRCHLAFGLNTPILGDHKYSHFSRIAPQRLHSEMLQNLGIRQAKVRHVPMHLHASSVILPEFSDGRNTFISAKLPAHFRQNMKWLHLKVDK